MVTGMWAADSRSSARPSPPCSPPRLHSGTSVSPRPEHHCITKNTCHVSRHSLAHAGTCPHPPGRWAAPGDTYRLPILEPHDLRGRKAVRLTLQRQGLPSQARHVGPASVLPDAGGHWEQAEAQELPPAPGEPQRPGPRLGRPSRPGQAAPDPGPTPGPHTRVVPGHWCRSVTTSPARGRSSRPLQFCTRPVCRHGPLQGSPESESLKAGPGHVFVTHFPGEPGVAGHGEMGNWFPTCLRHV